MYTSRLIGFGIHAGNPIVSYTLASKSIPYRELRADLVKKKVNVFPRKGFENHETNLDPEIDNYACIKTLATEQGDRYLIVFNGHMCKRTYASLIEGVKPSIALDSVLTVFRGAKCDARIGAIVHLDKNGIVQAHLGLNDSDRGEKRIARYPNERVQSLENRLVYIYDKDTNFEKVFPLSFSGSLEGLAEHIHENVVGERIDFGIATAAASISEGDFEFGIYNKSIQ